MKGKGVRTPLMIMGVLILGLVVAQTLVEAKSCCKNTTGRNCYNVCRVPGTPQAVCAALCDCKIITGTTCPSDYPKFSSLENSGAINHYCKLGCASSVCNTISTHHNSDVGEEVVNEAVEHCNKACSEFCNKGVNIALATA